MESEIARMMRRLTERIDDAEIPPLRVVRLQSRLTIIAIKKRKRDK